MKDKLEDCLIAVNYHARRVGFWNRFCGNPTTELKESAEKLAVIIRQASQHFEHGVVENREELAYWLNLAESILSDLQKRYAKLRHL